MWAHENNVDAESRQSLVLRYISDPLAYTRFNAAQLRAIAAAADPEAAVIVAAMGNGTGKTYALIAIMSAIMFGTKSPELSAGVLGKWPYPRNLRIVTTSKNVEDGGPIQRAMRELFPVGEWSQSRGSGKGYFSQGKTTLGPGSGQAFFWDIMTYNQSIEDFAGDTKGAVFYSEPPPHELFVENLARLRAGGFSFIEMTPLNSAAWVKDDYVDRGALFASDGREVGKVRFVVGDIEENCRDHSPGGQLPHEAIERTLAAYPDEEREARRTGQFLHVAGRIFKTWHREKFVSKSPIPVDPLGVNFQVIDPGGFNKPFAIIWGQVVAHPLHGIRILREWPNGSRGPDHYFEKVSDPQMKIEDYARMFDEVEKSLGWGRRDVVRILDKRFGHVRDLDDGKSLRDHFEERGFMFQDSYSVPGGEPEMKTGIMAVQAYLKNDPLTGIPLLSVDPSCVNLARAFDRWAINPKTQAPEDDSWKNMMDAVRYACSAGLEWREKIPVEDWHAEQIGGPTWSTRPA